MIRRAAVHGLALRQAFGLVAALALSAPARAQESFLLPLEADAPLALGTAWDRDEAQPVGEQGTCMAGAGPDRHEGGPTTWTLVVLSRAGGRLLVGAHVARTVASEGLADARIPDAARRLAQRDGDEFRALCGDGFVSARALGGQYVGEIEIGPAEAPGASARLRTGVWTEPTPFAAVLEALAGVRGAQARELPGGRRANAVPITVAELAQRAFAFPDTVTAENAAPFLAMVRSYPEWAFAGTAIAIDPTLGWGDAARAVFLRDAGPGVGSTAAARAAEMRKAVVKRRAGDPRRPFGAPAGVVVPESPAAPASAAEEAPAAAAVPLAVAEQAAPPADEPPPAAVAAPEPPAVPAQRHRMAALVYEAAPSETPVFATTEAPPGVYAEKVKQRVYWVPGVAEASPALREALTRAAAGSPARGTTIVVAEVGGSAVVLTDVAPAAGVHAEPAGALQAWIAGVSEPTPAQREALAAAARGGD